MRNELISEFSLLIFLSRNVFDCFVFFVRFLLSEKAVVCELIFACVQEISLATCFSSDLDFCS